MASNFADQIFINFIVFTHCMVDVFDSWDIIVLIVCATINNSYKAIFIFPETTKPYE
jgi:hypothetical protein